MRKLLVFLACLMQTCSPPLPAQQKQSEQPLMVPLWVCEQELALLEQQSLAQLTKVENDFAVLLRTAVEGAAADAVRPLLVDIAGLKAERDAYRKAARCWKIAAAVGGGATVLSIATLVIHFLLPSVMGLPPP